MSNKLTQEGVFFDSLVFGEIEQVTSIIVPAETFYLLWQNEDVVTCQNDDLIVTQDFAV